MGSYLEKEVVSENGTNFTLDWLNGKTGMTHTCRQINEDRCFMEYSERE